MTFAQQKSTAALSFRAGWRPPPFLWDAATFAVALSYVAIYSWPVLVNPSRWVWGSHGDALGNAFEFTWINEAIRAREPLTIDHRIAIPFGEDLGSLPHEPLFYFVQVHLGSLIGAVASLNLISLLAVPIAAWVMYRLGLRATGSRAAAFLAGIAFGCSSFTLINSRGEPTLVQVWIFPLIALALLNVLSRPGARSILIAAIAITAASMVNFYYALFVALVSLTLVLAWGLAALLVQKRVPLGALAAAAVAGLLAVALSGTIFVSSLGNLQQRAGQIVRPPQDLALLAPEPADFLLPPRSNPWIGQFRQEHFELRAKRTGAFVDLGEMAVPIPVLLLAPVGAVLLFIRPALGECPESSRRRLEAFALLAIALLGLWLTVPPTFFRHRLMFLSLQWDLYSLAPQYRAFHRAVVLVELGACTFAAVAFAFLFGRRSKLVLPTMLGLTALVLVEAYQVPRDRLLEVASPPEYTWLAARPGDYAVAEYPLLPTNSGGNEYTYEFNQRFHGHPLLNGHAKGTESESMREEFRDPNRAGVPERLAGLGIRYVLWHNDMVETMGLFSPEIARLLSTFQPRPPSYHLEASFPSGAQVYSVEATPTSSFAFYAAGFSQLEVGPDGQWGRWMPSSKGRLDTFSSGGPSASVLRFQCQSESSNQALELRQSSGSLGSWQLPAGRKSAISVDAQIPPGISRLDMEVSPTPSSRIFCTTVRIDHEGQGRFDR